MKRGLRSKITSDTLVEYFQYDPNKADYPKGFSATTTSRGPTLRLPRRDGVHWVAQPMDWCICVESGDWIAIPDPAFRELFSELD